MIGDKSIGHLYWFIYCTANFKVDGAKSSEAAGVYSLLNLLPTAHCLSPDEVMKLKNADTKTRNGGMSLSTD